MEAGNYEPHLSVELHPLSVVGTGAKLTFCICLCTYVESLEEAPGFWTSWLSPSHCGHWEANLQMED